MILILLNLIYCLYLYKQAGQHKHTLPVLPSCFQSFELFLGGFFLRSSYFHTSGWFFGRSGNFLVLVLMSMLLLLLVPLLKALVLILSLLLILSILKFMLVLLLSSTLARAQSSYYHSLFIPCNVILLMPILLLLIFL